MATTSAVSNPASPLQITGLASGLDTNSIITALLSIQKQPITNLTFKQTGLNALSGQLTSLQTALQAVALNAQALSDPGLWANSQTVSSSNPSLVSATTATGAGVGGYQVNVTKLANSAQSTFTFASQSLPDTITIGGHATNLAGGASIQDLVNSINSDPNANVYAASTDATTVVLSSRATGSAATVTLTSDPGGTLTQKYQADGVTPIAHAGQDAAFTVDNGPTLNSSTNTATNAIPGVTLTLGGLTTTTGPVTVTVGAPAPSAASIQSAVTTFVNSYNSVIDQVSGQLLQKPTTSDVTQGQLFGDNEFTNLLSDMRTAMYAPGADATGSPLPVGMASLSDIGISTGAASGSSPFSAQAVAGKLTIDSTALANAIQSNPSGVRNVLQSWSQSFAAVVNNEAQPGGAIDARIQGDHTEVSNIGNQIANLTSLLNTRQTALQAQFAKLEATLSQYQSQGSWLTSQLAQLPLPAAL